MIEFRCLSCGKTYKVSENKAGRSGPCKQCGALVTVPMPDDIWDLGESQQPMIAHGNGAEVELRQDRLIIRRKGVASFFVHGLKGDKEILLSAIAAIQFKKVGMVSSGYIQFTIRGGREAKGGIFQAAQDENTVMFTKDQQAEFMVLKEAIDRRLAQQSAEHQAGQMPNDLDQIEKLVSLRDRGIITEEEFQAKKRQLLGL